MNSTPSPLAMAAQGLAPEVTVSRDIIKRGLMVAPAVMVIGGIIIIPIDMRIAETTRSMTRKGK